MGMLKMKKCAFILALLSASCSTVPPSDLDIERAKRWFEVFRPSPPLEQPETPSDELPAGLVWLNADISGWPVTASLNVAVNGDSLTLDSSKKDVWPNARQKAGDGSPMNATAVAIIQHEGKWYATAFEWMKRGQSTKSVSQSFRGGNDHMKAPLNNFKPKSGERYGFIVSAPSRNEQTIKERSELKWIVWP